jgi:putative PIN family toxin of toxin-antitoxin system
VIRVVFDTVVFVRSLINPRSSCGRLVFNYADQYKLCLSAPIVEEILNVLRRPELTRKFRGLGSEGVASVLDLIGQAEIVEITHLEPVSRDVKDDKFLATAVGANAGFLVSEDRDLLDIGEYGAIKIVDSATFLDILHDQLT